MVDTAIQLVGGVALVEDHPLAILYRKVRGWRLAEGASDVLRLNIGRGILELDGAEFSSARRSGNTQPRKFDLQPLH